MKRLVKLIHRTFYMLMVALCFFLLYPLLYAFSRKESHYKYLNKVRKANAFFASLFSGIVYKIDYEQEIDWSRNYIICANHASNLDIFALSVLVKNNFFFMGKAELLDSIFTKLYFQTVDVPVNRNSKISAYKSYKKTENRLQKGFSLVIFPEGKIGEEYPPVLLPFKNGPFKLAIDNNIPILPVTLINTWQLMWDDGKIHGSKPGVGRIYVHKPIEVSFLSDKNEETLKESAFKIVNSKINYKYFEDFKITLHENR